MPNATDTIRPLTAGEFDQIRRLAREKFGLDLRKGKEELVAARLARKMREARCRTFHEYHRHVLEDGTGEALIGLIDALATNHTGFLREPAHFTFLNEVVLPGLAGRDRIDIWSAACSTGEEPYTIAFSLLERLPGPARLRILATDISTRALATAERATYPAERFQEFPAAWMRRFLLRGESDWKGWYRVRPEVRQRIEFRRVNLIEPVAGVGRFPVIFCRNVMIYFDKPTQQRVIAGLAACLEPGGCLMVGHAEGLRGIEHSLRYVRPAIYRKVEGGLR